MYYKDDNEYVIKIINNILKFLGEDVYTTLLLNKEQKEKFGLDTVIDDNEGYFFVKFDGKDVLINNEKSNFNKKLQNELLHIVCGHLQNIARDKITDRLKKENELIVSNKSENLFYKLTMGKLTDYDFYNSSFITKEEVSDMINELRIELTHERDPMEN